MRRLVTAAVAALIACGLATPASAAFTLYNSEGATGMVLPLGPNSFVIAGSDGDSGCDCSAFASTASDTPVDFPSYLTAYYDTAETDLTIDIPFFYFTTDDDSSYDPAGYLIGESLFQVTPDDISSFEVYTGRFQFTVLAGEYYGFWVGSTDNFGGAAYLGVGQVPEPATWLLMIGGFGLIGAAMRRRHTAIA